MRLVIEDITPAMAEALLARNTLENRNVRDKLVLTYSADMAAGAWKVSHQAIAVSTDGEVIDGQHRLRAIVHSGATVRMPIIYGCDSDTFSVIDAGAPRSLADRLQWNKDVIAICSTLHRIASATGGKRITAAGIAPFLMCFGGLSGELIAQHSTNSRKISTSSTRAAVVLLAKEGQREWAFDAYARIISMTAFMDAPVAVQAWARHISERFGPSDRIDVFLRALVAFDRKNADLTKIIIRSPSDSVRAARDRIMRAMQ